MISSVTKAILFGFLVLIIGLLVWVLAVSYSSKPSDEECTSISVRSILTVNRDYIVYVGQDGNYYYDHLALSNPNLRQPTQNICVVGDEVVGGD